VIFKSSVELCVNASAISCSRLYVAACTNVPFFILSLQTADFIPQQKLKSTAYDITKKALEEHSETIVDLLKRAEEASGR
jgi:hypothetical protein